MTPRAKEALLAAYEARTRNYVIEMAAARCRRSDRRWRERIATAVGNATRFPA